MNGVPPANIASIVARKASAVLEEGTAATMATARNTVVADADVMPADRTAARAIVVAMLAVQNATIAIMIGTHEVRSADRAAMIAVHAARIAGTTSTRVAVGDAATTNTLAMNTAAVATTSKPAITVDEDAITLTPAVPTMDAVIEPVATMREAIMVVRTATSDMPVAATVGGTVVKGVMQRIAADTVATGIIIADMSIAVGMHIRGTVESANSRRTAGRGAGIIAAESASLIHRR